MPERLINPNLAFLHQCYKDGKSGVVQEGSSRSGKTWSNIDFLVWLCSEVESNATINIIKHTYNSFKTTLYDDFNRRLPMYGLSSPFIDRQEVRQFKLWNNKINLLGADSGAVFDGVSSDYFWINESLDVEKKAFDQSEQRCRVFWWMDYNPKKLQSYIYDTVCNRSDVGFIKTTIFDNPFASPMERRKILSYEPTHPDDRHLPVAKRRPHPTNIKEGTADDFLWSVYGLGLRSAPEGLVFQHVTYVNEMPDIEQRYYGLDFGSVDPTALVEGRKNGKDLYLKKLVYEPTDNPDRIIELIEEAGVKRSDYIYADSAASGSIAYLRRKGWNVFAVSKPAGSIQYGIGLLKNYRIHLVDCPEWKKEQTSYRYRTVNGVRTKEPIDGDNHLWDAARYLAMANFV